MSDDGDTRALDELLGTLEERLGPSSADGGDAIDEVLNSPARRTGAGSLKGAPEVAAFREALRDSHMRVDVVNRLLGLVNELLVRLGSA